MLQPEGITSITDKQPLWTHDEAIAFESARDTIGHMIAICSSLMGKEESKPNPDREKIKLLREKQSSLAAERRDLCLKDHANIARIEQEYGLEIKAFNEGVWFF
jgi:hypothetical protein